MVNHPTVHFEYGDNGEAAGRSLTVYQNGDVIRATVKPDGTLLFMGVVERSSLEMQSWILSAETLETGKVKRVLDAVIEAGGMWEQAFGGVLLIHAPSGIAKTIFDQITDGSSS